MPFVVTCSWCGEVLTEPGALLLSPPDDDGRVWKYHICYACWESERGILTRPPATLNV